MTERDPRRRSLGRGLDALLGGDETAAPSDSGSTVKTIQTLPVEFVHAGAFQPRKKFDAQELDILADSIRQNGVLQPILVRPDPARDGVYQIVAGERRWRAAQQAQLHEIPVVVKELGDAQALEIALVENLQRQDLSPLEEAEGFRRLMEEFSHTQEKLAAVIGKSRSHVANMIRLLGLPDRVKRLLDSGELSAGHARALLNAEDPEGLAEQVVLRGLNVRQTERLTKAGKAKPARRPDRGKSADTRALEQELGNRLGLSVTIRERGEGGAIVIRYKSLEQLDDVIERLNKPL